MVLLTPWFTTSGLLSGKLVEGLFRTHISLEKDLGFLPVKWDCCQRSSKIWTVFSEIYVATVPRIEWVVIGDTWRGFCSDLGKRVCGHSERNKKWRDSPDISKVGYPDGLNMGCERKRRSDIIDICQGWHNKDSSSSELTWPFYHSDSTKNQTNQQKMDYGHWRSNYRCLYCPSEALGNFRPNPKEPDWA